MIKQIKQITLTVSLGILALILIQSYSHGAIMGNYGDTMFTDDDGHIVTGDDNTGLIASANPSLIGMYIAEGAGYFLKSQASVLRLLNNVEMIELEGLDRIDFNANLCRAIDDMEMAKFFYTLLNKTSVETSYNPDMIKVLIDFDYQRFQVERGLNPTIFQRVRNYLEKGDVTSFFGYLQARTEVILTKLYKIRDITETNQLPSIKKFWKLNQVYSETLMTGQYSAQVFYEVKSTSL